MNENIDDSEYMEVPVKTLEALIDVFNLLIDTRNSFPFMFSEFNLHRIDNTKKLFAEFFTDDNSEEDKEE